jgi:elongator complex protein 2
MLQANHAGTLMVSSCKAALAEHAALHVWDTATWQVAYTLPGHKLSVTRAAFSNSDEWLVSGSRDRQVCVFRRGGSGGSGGERFELVQTIAKAHDRIIWDLSWSLDDAFFATGSRDKTVRVWGRQHPLEPPVDGGGVADTGAMPAADDAWAPACTLGKLRESVTALDWAPRMAGGRHVLAVGYDDGGVELFTVSAGSGSSSDRRVVAVTSAPLVVLQPALAATDTVRRLLWRRGADLGDQSAAGDVAVEGAADSTLQPWQQQLAFCSLDGSVRIVLVLLDLLIEAAA